MRRLARAAACAACAWGLGGCGDGGEPARGDPVVVGVRVGAGPGAGQAVGIAVGADRVLTVAHVLDGAGPPRVRLPSGVRVTGCVLARDATGDAALVRVPGLTTPAARWSPGAPTARVVSLRGGRAASRAPRGERPLRARIRAAGAPDVRRRVLRLGIAVRPGDSGSPALDADGRLTGMVFATVGEGRPAAYATAGAPLRALVERAAGRAC